jgi:hypothetical protein
MHLSGEERLRIRLDSECRGSLISAVWDSRAHAMRLGRAVWRFGEVLRGEGG